MTVLTHHTTIEMARSGSRLSDDAILSLANCDNLSLLMDAAAEIRDREFGDNISYSKKVFVPLTQLCRDVCHYCTFAHAPNKTTPAYLSIESVLRIARSGKDAGCKEVLFTLGDKPELRYRSAKDALRELGYESTLEYLVAACDAVLKETGLIPHLNPGLLKATDMQRLRRVSGSMGVMLETIADRLSSRGGPHFGSPDKDPKLRLEMIDNAGANRIPFTTGLLIGIGETRGERIQSLLALRRSHERFGHIQEIIIQNFRPKAGTLMANAPAASLDDQLWTVAIARLTFGSSTSIQAPPNLNEGNISRLVDAGINDWGGISPVTVDYVNPEAPWPQIDTLAKEMSSRGKRLIERVAIYPGYARDAGAWLDRKIEPSVLKLTDSEGYAREDDWIPGGSNTPAEFANPTAIRSVVTPGRKKLNDAIDKASSGQELTEAEIVTLFNTRAGDATAVIAAADSLRKKINGDSVSFVTTRNINYTNICTFHCQFCAFSKGKRKDHRDERVYNLDLSEIGKRVREAWSAGATEVCLQGGIHPSYTGETYLSILKAAKQACPDIHVHAFSPLEIQHGASTLGISVSEFLTTLKQAGLGSLPGTAAEILDDSIRQIICPDKLNTAEWLTVMRAAHLVGLRSTATIMFGHVDGPVHWARHLLHIRSLQKETGGFTEFVPLPFVPMEAPIYLKGKSRRGATLRESILMHAVSRLVLHPLIRNIQVSWVKMGEAGVKMSLRAGVNDLGGTLMNESISRAAGAVHGQSMTPQRFSELASAVERKIWQRTTLYEPVSAKQAEHSASAMFAET
ncbi:5-amino-6-(D-ribitylamino)uracil--L-tyrosine 4-hydroxyphenyl transferase CofH [Bradyrhizobium canariense]|uniref:FO synthase n=1 Tax=Bradyrhizobium canariense TaxID=255045 RepID=A0A1H1YQI8_9BRAD|nr:5-amino-6-(D-ribitylamino)uracil--L-tyrosine 4-hydroxyphenyl transferase CofH [Bradyrhizobium canariense]SDT23745.1 FO synthase subunit 1 /FO synthase subunit 2 [Bradyrhizobium canariense]